LWPSKSIFLSSDDQWRHHIPYTSANPANNA
jgi:hypothetical protein